MVSSHRLSSFVSSLYFRFISPFLHFVMADNSTADPQPQINVAQPQLSSEATEALVYHVVLFIIAFIGLFAVLRLPRVVARFWRAAEWTSGHILYRTSDYSPRPPPKRQVLTRNRSTNRTIVAEYPESTDGSHTLKGETSMDDDPKAYNLNYPPHIASLPRIFRRFLAPHRYRIAPNYSIGQGIIVIIWFSVMLYAGLYKSSPFTDPNRSGWVAVAQVPFVIALATKNNILGQILGFTYEKVCF